MTLNIYGKFILKGENGYLKVKNGSPNLFILASNILRTYMVRSLELMVDV